MRFLRNLGRGGQKPDACHTSHREVNPSQHAQGEEHIQPFPDADEPTRLLFNAFRDCTYLFKDASGLDWEHLLPGIQAASVIHFIRDRGKERTSRFLLKLMQDIEPELQHITPKAPRREPYMTPLHVTNMAVFNETILRAADDYVTNAGCHPRLTAHALSMLVVAITTTHFDLIKTMAILAASREAIAEGRYDRYRQDAL